MGCNQSAAKVQELTSKVRNLLRWIYQLKLRLDDLVSTTDGRFQFVCCTHVNDILYTYIISAYIMYVSLYIYISIISYLYNDAWYFLWGPSFLSSSIPLLNGHPATRPSTRRNRMAWEAATPWWYQSRRRRGFSCFYWWDSMGLLVCWSWRWIGKSTIFNNPTVGIEDDADSLFWILF